MSGIPPPRKVGKGPFILVISILAVILVFVGYPVQKIFLGGQLLPWSSAAYVPKKGDVGYLKVDEGYKIFAARDRKVLLLWEATIRDPAGLSKAREMLRSGQVFPLMPNTSVVSVDPTQGILKILTGSEFGHDLFVSMLHVRFIVLHQ